MLAGLKALLTLQNIGLMIIISIVGLVIGALPGLSAGIATALLIPFTFAMTPATGLASLAVVYMSAVYGGCFSAILINTPGTPSSIATCYDGYPLAKQGKGIKAIIYATVGSFNGGIMGCLVLLLVSPYLAKVTLKFGSPEYFWLGIFGLTIMASLGEGNILKTVISGFVGLLISCVGVTTMGGTMRFNFGTFKMQGGVNITVAMIGMFCIPEVLSMLGNPGSLYDTGEIKDVGSLRSEWKDAWHEIKNSKAVIGLSSAIGVVTGILPGAGGTIANILAYNEAKKISKNKDKFGTGIAEGVLAPEAANNATVGAGMIPTLTLGIPGTPVAAIIYGAMLMHGLQPGIALFEKSGDIAYCMIWAFFLACIIMLIVGLSVGTTLYKAISKVSQKYLVTGVMLLAIIGAYAVRNNVLDIVIMWILGLLAYLFKKINLSSGAMVLGLVLGSITENAFARSMLLTNKTPWPNVFLTRPISLVLILLSALSFLVPIIQGAKKKKQQSVNE